MDIRLYKTFLAVAEGLSFRRAAQALHLAPSTVTCQVRDLEEQLGATLFDRAGRAVALTEAGRRLNVRARELVDLEDRVRRELAGAADDPSVELRVRISESLGIRCLPAILPQVRRRFPSARLTFATRSADSLHRDLRARTMDLALLLGEPTLAPGLRTTVLGRLELAWIVAPGTNQPPGPIMRPGDLEGRTLILTPHVWGVRPQIDQALAENDVAPSAIIECGSLEIVKRLVAAGLGVSIAPRFAVNKVVEAGLLRAMTWELGELNAPVALVQDRDRPPSPVALAFVEAVQEYFGSAR